MKSLRLRLQRCSIGGLAILYKASNLSLFHPDDQNRDPAFHEICHCDNLATPYSP
ncbi:MAG: hypothetical protein KDN22_06010 [Verrucomicrobiae bacterium]|nr:hypothetical protein [Verrucomicrobiae bacterium]